MLDVGSVQRAVAAGAQVEVGGADSVGISEPPLLCPVGGEVAVLPSRPAGGAVVEGGD